MNEFPSGAEDDVDSAEFIYGMKLWFFNLSRYGQARRNLCGDRMD